MIYFRPEYFFFVRVFHAEVNILEVTCGTPSIFAYFPIFCRFSVWETDARITSHFRRGGTKHIYPFHGDRAPGALQSVSRCLPQMSPGPRTALFCSVLFRSAVEGRRSWFESPPKCGATSVPRCRRIDIRFQRADVYESDHNAGRK